MRAGLGLVASSVMGHGSRATGRRPWAKGHGRRARLMRVGWMGSGWEVEWQLCMFQGCTQKVHLISTPAA